MSAGSGEGSSSSGAASAVRVVKQRHDDPVQIGAAAPHCRSRQPSVLEVGDLLGTEFVLSGGNGPHQDQPLPCPGERHIEHPQFLAAQLGTQLPAQGS